MSWYWIVLITYFAMCCITLILNQIDDSYALCWALGLPYIIINALLYPVRAWITWGKCENYYRRHNITRLQYILGKREKSKKRGKNNEKI